MSEPSSVVTEFINSAMASSGVCKGAAITPGVPGRLQLTGNFLEVYHTDGSTWADLAHLLGDRSGLTQTVTTASLLSPGLR